MIAWHKEQSSSPMERAISELKKDPVQEQMLLEMNELVEGVESRLETDHHAPQRPILFILGLPRSGTTLTHQVLSSTGQFGYISNFIARFWKAPCLGIRIQQALKIDQDGPGSNFESNYGVTSGWMEPHEFGYYWTDWFDVGIDVNKLSDEELALVDREGLSRSLAAMEAAFDAPLLIKSGTWMTLQTEFLADLFPNSIFAVPMREPLFVAQSILMNRQKHLGSKEAWLSVRPREFPSLQKMPWWDQIAGQIDCVTRDIDSALGRISPDRVIRFGYEQLCESPQQVVRDVFNAFEQWCGDSLDMDRQLPAGFVAADTQRIPDEDFRLLEQALLDRSSGCS